MSKPVLPTDIHREILNRVAEPESLLRFRCVCKDWRSIIDDPVFAKSHHYDMLLIQVPSTKQFICTLPLQSLNLYSETTQIQPTEVPEVEIDSFANRLLLPEPPCHGFVLNARTSLWAVKRNWLLCKDGQSAKSIPPYDGFLPTETERIDHTAYFGIGYDAATDDYKVVRIAVLLDPTHNGPYVLKTLIYSLKLGAWHRADDFPRPEHEILQHRPQGAAFVNGALHWVTGDHYVARIVALDLTTETYRNLPLPPHEIHNILSLDALGEHLFLSYGSKENTIWILKDYGGDNKWTRLIYQNSYNSNMRPIAFIKRKDQVIICNRGNELMWFDVKNEEPLKKVTLLLQVEGIRRVSFRCQVFPGSLNRLNRIGVTDEFNTSNGRLETETESVNHKLKLKLKVSRY